MVINRRAQSTIEFALLVLVSVAALISMSVYVKRAVQGQTRQTASDLGEQYDPRHTNSVITTTRVGSTTTESDSTENEGLFTSTSNTTIHSDATTRTGNENIEAMGGLWD